MKRALALLLLIGCRQETAVPAPELRIAAAASLKEPLLAANPAFEAKHPGVKFTISFEASSTLSRQVEAAAPYDCFLSADAANVDRLGDKVVAATRTEFLGNELVVCVRDGLAPMPASAADLVKLSGKFALAGEAVPVGKYARAWLTKAGQLDALKGKIVNAEDVRATLALVESGAADAAVVYATDARSAKSAKLAFAAPKDEAPPVVYVAAAVTASKSPLAAEYVRWLRSADFQQAAEKFGFKTVTP